MVQSLIPAGITDPKGIIGSDGVIFGELLGWGARVAIGKRQGAQVFAAPY